MNQGIDPQAQQDGESDRAYLAYTTYRDMGVSRTESGAYEIYLAQIGKGRQKGAGKSRNQPSASFYRWSSIHSWDDRIRDWDSKKLQRIQSAQLEADYQGYLDKIAKTRLQLERISQTQLSNSEKLSVYGSRQLDILIRDTLQSKGWSKADLVRCALIGKNCIDAMALASAARHELFTVLGIEDLEKALIEKKGGKNPK